MPTFPKLYVYFVLKANEMVTIHPIPSQYRCFINLQARSCGFFLFAAWRHKLFARIWSELCFKTWKTTSKARLTATACRIWNQHTLRLCELQYHSPFFKNVTLHWAFGSAYKYYKFVDHQRMRVQVVLFGTCTVNKTYTSCLWLFLMRSGSS